MRWDGIQSIEVNELKGNILPCRVRLLRGKGNEVKAGGHTLPEAVVTLFSTAGFGRFPPSVLAEIITKKIGDRITHPVWNRIISECMSSRM